MQKVITFHQKTLTFFMMRQKLNNHRENFMVLKPGFGI